MRATIDQAGRVVLPKPLREHVGFQPGEVDVTVDGSALRIEQAAGEALQERDGRLTIPAAGVPISDELVRSLRDAGQR
jgi:AbrB family looped-hinge helix DNA binding protein